MFSIKETTYTALYAIAKQLNLLTDSDLESASSENVTIIQYTIPVANVWDEVKKRTAFLAKFRSGEQSLMDVVNMSEDEMQLFEPFLTDISEEIAERMRTMSRAVIPSYIYREEAGMIIAKDADNKDTYEYNKENINYLIERRNWMTPQALQMADTRLLEALVLGVMYKWFSFAIPQESLVYEKFYIDAKQKLSTALNQSNTVQRKYTYPN